MLYLGGIGTIWGPIIGAVIVSLLPEALRGLKELQDVAYAAVLILILIFAPKGLSALLPRIGRRGAPSRKESRDDRHAAPLGARGVTKRFGGLLANDSHLASTSRKARCSP